jgi:hypothetical protein
MAPPPPPLPLFLGNVILIAVLAGSLAVARALVRNLRLRRMAKRALCEGRPRRYRAILRVRWRSRRRPSWQQTLEQAAGLFWCGEFDRALACAEPLRRASGTLSDRSRAAALSIQCLAQRGRHVEARQLFDKEVTRLVPVDPRVFAGADEALLEAMLLFHEGSLDASRERLEASLSRLNSRWPMAKLVHFYLAAIEQTGGRTDSARVHLEEAIDGGGDFFVSRWAAYALAEVSPGAAHGPRRTSRRAAHARRKPASRLLSVLGGGLQLLFFERSATKRWLRASYEQMAQLALINVVWAALLRCLEYRRGASFLEFPALACAAPLFSLGVTVYLATRGSRTPRLSLQIGGALYSALPWLYLIGFANLVNDGHSLRMDSFLALLGATWSMALFLFLLRRFDPQAKWARLGIAGAIFAATWIVPLHYVAPFAIWYRLLPEPTGQGDDRGLAAFTYQQADLVHSHLSSLRPERPGVADLYFVGFAGWGDQHVFLGESLATEQLFDAKFDTQGRSLVLSNDPSTRATLPLASILNLGHVLRTLGSQMNREEDVLFLFLTSHGWQTGLSLRAPDAPELYAQGEITPAELRALLDEADIKWRVLLVSSCKSGVFVAPLSNEFTLIATASAANRVSFGCAPENEFTAYGRAVFEQLTTERSFPAAFAKANDVIAQREASAALEPSQPQLFVGSAIAEKLRSLESRLNESAARLPTEDPSPVKEKGGGRP